MTVTSPLDDSIGRDPRLLDRSYASEAGPTACARSLGMRPPRTWSRPPERCAPRLW